MKYDFTSILERKGMDSIAVDLETAASFAPKGETLTGFERIPMWVADMNFPTAPSVTEAIIQRAKHPAFGYFIPRPEYYQAIINWQSTRNNVEGLSQENIGYENGVLGGLVSALKSITSSGDHILLHSPTYIGFTGVLENNGYHITDSPLKKDKDDVWRMDLEDMEDKIKKYHIHATIFCSPHNPTGRVWTREEIRGAMDLFEKYHVYVISDEIWSDILLDGHKHTPTQMVSEYSKNHTVALYAPSKTFNLAGLIGSYHIIYDPWLRDRVEKESSLSDYNSMNVLSMHALIGAYSSVGMEWLDELRTVLGTNVDKVYSYLTQQVEGIELAKPEGTYMLFLDCEKYCKNHGISIEELQKKGVKYGVIWQDGRPFHGEYGIRMNVALPTARVEEAIRRMDQYIFTK
ncbi:MAG: aminotransferase class I/II-fold pyridoxal phosphate-dependent enzyme [Lachnospiraceae bacterium]|nr:aminotransferase class I/II-fold pyridoxal phosphate-dependent enzyme [Lachnospiraceae bacterium]